MNYKPDDKKNANNFRFSVNGDRTDLQGQFVYAALLDLGQTEKYIATIKLDDAAADKRALFKDISIKKGSLYAGQTQNSTSANATLPADPDITIQQLVDFVKSDFAGSPFFSEKIPQKGNFRFSVSPVYTGSGVFYTLEAHDLDIEKIKTTGLAGGMHHAFKAMVPAARHGL